MTQTTHPTKQLVRDYLTRARAPQSRRRRPKFGASWAETC